LFSGRIYPSLKSFLHRTTSSEPLYPHS
jgi:hypothetical protein